MTTSLSYRSDSLNRENPCFSRRCVSIGQAIKEIRIELSLTQETFAASLNIDPFWLESLESDRLQITDYTESVVAKLRFQLVEMLPDRKLQGLEKLPIVYRSAGSTPLIRRCCLCGEIREIADSDFNPRWNAELHYCFGCLGNKQKAPVLPSPVSGLPGKPRLKAINETPESIVLAAIGDSPLSKSELNSRIKTQYGSYLKATPLAGALKKLKNEGRLECKSGRYSKARGAVHA
jgi:DNA-binding XRE family transcriptional regulator